jgi:hypothetical protein
MMVELACYLVAVILFVLAAAGVPSRVNLLALGLAFAFFPPLLDAIQAVG